MIPSKVGKAQQIYGAPPGLEGEIGGLPFWRTQNEFGTTSVHSLWRPDAEDLKVLNEGGYVRVEIIGEPIHPMSVTIMSRNEAEAE